MGGVGVADGVLDYYEVLRLPTGEEGAALTAEQIEKAYKAQSRLRHPDKRPDDPSATADFQLLRAAYDVLRDEPARRAFDARLRACRQKAVINAALDSRRNRLATDLDARERAAAAAASAPDPTAVERRREREAADQLKRELEQFQARAAKRPAGGTAASSQAQNKDANWHEKDQVKVALDKAKMLKVSWEGNVDSYSATRLREIFSRYGEVEDIVIRTKRSRSRGSAIVVMSSKEAAMDAIQNSIGDVLAIPLLIVPLQDSDGLCSRSSEQSEPQVVAFNDFEAAIMEKLKKASG